MRWKRSSPSAQQKRASTALFATAVFLAACCYLRPTFPITGSIPRGLYWQERQPELGSLRAGELVAICLPPEFNQEAIARGYWIPGGLYCRSGEVLLLKRILALPGDRVLSTSEGLTVNGFLLAGTRARTADSKGRALRPSLPVDSEILLGPGQFWIGNHHERSYDSRYHGPIPAPWIVSRLHRIF